MSVVAVQTQEDMHTRIEREIVDGVPLGRTATASPIYPTPSLTEERPAKKHPAQRIRREKAELATVY